MSGNVKFRWFLLAPLLVALFVVVNSPVISMAGELEDAKEKVRQNPNDANAHGRLGGIYLTLGRYQEAITSLKEAIRLDPNYALAHSGLGVAYELLGHDPTPEK